MDFEKPLVDKQIIVDLLYGDESFVQEFAAASIESFTEFKINFEKSVLGGDIEMLRKVGHKIKPVAQIMKLDYILMMYEQSKNLLEDEAPHSKLNILVENMNNYCDQLLSELNELAG